ncbi:TolC family protein [Phorcysia thermohydrogeniphila]|uniref:Outer membrane protein TolC n=1 Tax=Phorcysia thermohydrogeniphila TaxID=936138 RepID=A0A4R1GDM7_9BACT|nr:TolC family protein [Phorcysia thermohydrogeniphila]TCK06447.1 outer membrane protein TolC [Phorcysia thermohydrogeniphila]
MRFLAFLLAFLVPFTVKADTLSTIVKAALENNPEIKRALEEERISELQYREAIANFLPDISLQYTRTSLSDVPGYSMAFPGLPATRFEILESSFYEFKLSLRQPLFTGGRLSFGVKLRKELKTATFYRFKETVLKVLTEVKKDYYSLLEAKSAVEIAEKILESAKEHYKTVKAFYDEGVVPRRDLLEAAFKVKEAEENLERAKSAYRKTLEKLKKDTGYSLENIPLDGEKLDYVPVKLSEEELIDLALENRPIIKALQATKKGADYGVKLTYSQFLPAVFLSFSYDRTDQYPGIGTFDASAVSVLVNFPIFQGGKRFWKLKEAKSKKRQVELSLEETKHAVRLQVVAALSSLKAAKARVEAAEAMVEDAKELLKTSRERYREHVGTSTEVVDAIAYLARAEGFLNSALADYNRALAELEYATGVTLKGAP